MLSDQLQFSRPLHPVFILKLHYLELKDIHFLLSPVSN